MNNKESNKIDKPILLVIEETKKNLAEVINNSNLANFILEPIVNDILVQIRNSINNEYNIQKAQYEKKLIEQESKKEGE